MISTKSKGRKIRSVQKVVTPNPAYGMAEFPKDGPGVIYVRQSNIKQKQNNIHSFEMQTEKFLEYFRDRGCTGKILIVPDDEGMSGTIDIHKMPGLTRVMALIEGQELVDGERIRWAAAVHVNRFTRDKWLVKPGTIMKACYENDVWIATLRMDFNFQDEYCQRVFMIEAEESARHLEWMKLILGGGLRTASSKGYYDGRWLVPGYIVDRTDDKKKKFVIYEPHAKVVRWLFRRFFQLDGDFPKLCREVAEMPFFFPKFEPWVDSKNVGKFPGNREKKGTLIKEGPNAGNYRITKEGLKSILTNPVYIGWWLPIGGGVIEDNHDRITEDALFVYAHKRLSTYDLAGERQKPMRVTRYGRSENILKKVIVDERDQTMYVVMDRDRPFYKSYEQGDLTSRYRFSVDANEFDRIFLEKLFERLNELGDKLTNWSDQQKERQRAKAQERAEKKSLIRKQIDRAIRQRAEIMETMNDPDIPKTKQMKIDYATQAAGLEKKINQWELELATPDEEVDDEATLYEIHSLLPNIQTRWNKLSYDVRLRFVNALVQKVVISPAAPSWRKLEIYWKPVIGNVVDVAHVLKPYTNKTSWTQEEETIIRELYPTADAMEILQLIPNRSWQSIYARASKLGIKRERNRQPNSVHVTMQDPGTPEDRKYEEENGIILTGKKVYWSSRRHHRRA
jgi:hypothetical protein